MAINLLKRINGLIPLPRLIRFLIGISVAIQLIVIIYNNLSGFYPLQNFTHFLLRLLRGVLLTVPAAVLIAVPDLLIIDWMNRRFPWSRRVMPRVLIQFVATLAIAVLISVLMTLTANSITPYTEDLDLVLLYNALIYSVVNIIIMGVFEAWIFYFRSAEAGRKAEALERELTQMRFEMLKSQINPHFMFNSLNVLSGLIEKDVKKAQEFIDEFSQIYRYVLETVEQPTSTLGKELEFMRSYLFLQQMRHGDDLTWSVNLPAGMLDLVMPPLSLQVVLENAIKHNIVNHSKPLHIEIGGDEMTLVVSNRLQPKISSSGSTGVGLKNLTRRYSLITDRLPQFAIENDHFVARLPLINPENNEGPYN
ncbi:MAG: sensor histidine kinase [Bacteroidales bacterium]|jgi:LytS/YehU family sensor histidine kinase|nr:sensor histidine kinase [Bacteroidales bacterium]